jgi:hypothetical protein
MWKVCDFRRAELPTEVRIAIMQSIQAFYGLAKFRVVIVVVVVVVVMTLSA